MAVVATPPAPSQVAPNPRRPRSGTRAVLRTVLTVVPWWSCRCT